ncbi:type I restriction-modification system, M subunit [Enterococcus haemoperoxidus ATCC BAA-382]|uniref:site-specific DNA-methyltransferase (adenine-specific) n=1 Tax=Enterococcus haemoperoxidus ATCC BAA-382 TaxID=1158608 RepID=R2SY22_9ENTE|nr:type I restriction-modification system subunit M [Enterococcus haemoperoxidus]EOH92889.1 type I restriction-modification system, M subunit [Enterococcus haemoperoxidus ATCC BAA-382]EOT61632.1 type I restriction-modification system, M subunit [Enterococcus haemoperoxidus ATCC BAA-382]
MSDNRLQTITSKLWAMANELRGNMDAGEFKNYILAFMFYRYLSEHQEEYLVTNNVIDVDKNETVNAAYMRQAVGVDATDYLDDISSSLGYAIAPNDTWVSLNEKIDNSMIIPSDYQTIFDNFNKNVELNKDAAQDFSGVFNDINLGDSRLGNSTTARAKSLNNIVKLVDDIEYKSDEGKDILGEIYEYLIGQFAASAGKKGGEFYTPHQISKILAKLVTNNLTESENTFTVYDPTMGSGSLLLTVRGEVPGGDRSGAVKFFGQELNTTTYNLARMNLMMHNVSYSNMTLSNADTLESDWPDGLDSQGIDRPRSFDAVVANPPYSAKWDNTESKLKDPRFSEYGKLAPGSKADFAFILHSIYHLNSTGTMAIVLPHGVLFRGAAEEKIRQTLIEKNYLDAVIGLPANLFYGTSIPTTILVFKKNRKKREILFIDASNEFEKNKNQNNLTDEHVEKIIRTFQERNDIEKYAHLATLEEIKENSYNLNIPRYVDTFEEEEPIDIVALSKEMVTLNSEIKNAESDFLSLLNELAATPDVADMIKATKAVFSNER